MVIIPHPVIGDGFAARAGKKVLVVHPDTNPDEIVRFAFSNGIVVSTDSGDTTMLHILVFYALNPEEFREYPCYAPPIQYPVRRGLRAVN